MYQDWTILILGRRSSNAPRWILRYWDHVLAKYAKCIYLGMAQMVGYQKLSQHITMTTLQ